jgi:cobalt-zinc-cadmium efflux system membrane fusion protein
MKKNLIAMTVALALCGCGHKDDVVEGSTKEAAVARTPGEVALPADSPKLQQIRVANVETGIVPTDQVVVPGRIEVNPNRVSHVALPVSGRVSNVGVKIGDYVKQGQPLFTVDSAEVDAAMGAGVQADAGVNQAKANLLKAEKDSERAHDLLDHGAIAQKEVINADNALSQAKASLEQAEAVKRQAVSKIELYGLKPNQFGQKLTVHAPISGKVLELSLVPGEYHNDTTNPVITIADLSTVWVSSDVPETYIRFIQVGERLDCELAAYPGRTFTGRVTRISDTVDPQTRTIRVRAEIANPAGMLKPEMFGKIRHVESTEQRPIVPEGAIIQDENKASVFVETARGRFQQTPVKIGAHVGSGVAVMSGLRAGDRIVVDGAMLLKGM